MALKTYESCLQFPDREGLGDQDTGMDAEAILTREKENMECGQRPFKKEDAGIINVLSYEKSLPQPEGGNQGNGHSPIITGTSILITAQLAAKRWPGLLRNATGRRSRPI